jgi:hypothetical protein
MESIESDPIDYSTYQALFKDKQPIYGVERNSDTVLRHTGVRHTAQYGHRLLRPTNSALRV